MEVSGFQLTRRKACMERSIAKGPLWRFLQTRIHSHTAVLVGRYIFLCFGYWLDNTEFNNKMFVLDIKLEQWAARYCRGVLPDTRRTQSVTLVNDYLYLVGGKSNDTGIRGGYSDIWRFDLVLHRWEQCSTRGEIMIRSSGHSAAYFECRRQLLLVSCGIDNTPVGARSVLALQVDTHELSLPNIKGKTPWLLPYASSCQSECAMYIFGGKTFGEPPHSSDELHILHVSPIELQWSSPNIHGSVPLMRRSSQLCLFNGNLFLFGGKNDEEYLDDLHVFDTLRNSWKKVEYSGFKTRLAGHSALVCGRRILVVGGESPSGSPSRTAAKNFLILTQTAS